MRRKTREEVIRGFQAVHGDRYDYSEVEYVSYHVNVLIRCPDHGVFSQSPANHLSGKGCSKCGRVVVGDRLRSNHTEFIQQAKEIHSDTYDYSQADYVDSRTRVKIICPVHGEFLQTPQKHLSGQGCPKCGIIRRVQGRTMNREDFIAKASAMPEHKGVDYSLVDYVNNWTPVQLICEMHGEFWQAPCHHLTGSNCPKCSDDIAAVKRSLSCLKFISTATGHPNHKHISYRKAEYISRKQPVLLICDIHGEFWQVADYHLGGCGCPKCGHVGSIAERELKQFVDDLGVSYTPNDRQLLSGKELDIYIPEHQFAIEYNGSFWHSEHPIAAKGGSAAEVSKHLKSKQEACRERGVQLLQVMDTDNLLVVKKLIASRLGADPEVIGARKCVVQLASKSQAEEFYNNNHVQGFAKGCLDLGLHFREQLVACMSFSRVNSERGQKSSPDRWELRRFATCCRVPGGASKLLKAFIKEHPECREIISYSDNRLFTGKMYGQLGFSLLSDSPPDYSYVGKKGFGKKYHFKRSELAKMPEFDFRPEETEVQNCNRNGWYRVWDCGKKKWSLKL